MTHSPCGQFAICTDAILIGRCERRKLRFRLSSFTICEPEVFLI
jgi:hypothetical protein